MGTRPEDEFWRLLKGRKSGGTRQKTKLAGEPEVRSERTLHPQGDRWLHPEGNGQPVNDFKQAGDMIRLEIMHTLPS